MAALYQYRSLQQTVQREISSTSAKADSQEIRSEDSDGKYSVTFSDHDDSDDPRQWKWTAKARIIVIIWFMVFWTGWSSSADATAHGRTARYWHVSEVTESLATSMYLFGVAFGAVVAGPVSESFGRLPTYLATFAVYLVWTMASALANDYAAQIIFRGFAGLFASATMSIYGGSLADLLDVKWKARIWPVFALSPLIGPTIAPIANGWITQNLGWEWDDWITLILSGATFLLAIVMLPETSSSMILYYKAYLLRQATGESDYQSETGNASLSTTLQTNLRRIVSLMFTELTTVAFGLYMTVLYMLIFGFLEGFDFIFTNAYGFDIGQRYSVFAAIALGILAGLPYVMVLNSWRVPEAPTPEQRLRPALATSPLLAASLFWIGWTDKSDVAYWSPIAACFLFGFSLMGLFTPTYHYLLDSYGTIASSALAAVTFARYLASGGMVLATQPLYGALSVKWMLTLLGCIAAVLAPVPWAFYIWGPQIRARSNWARGGEDS